MSSVFISFNNNVIILGQREQGLMFCCELFLLSVTSSYNTFAVLCYCWFITHVLVSFLISNYVSIINVYFTE